MSKKKKAGIVVLVILLILAAAAGTIYFLGHRYYSKTNFLSDEEAVEQIEKQKAERKAAQKKTATEEEAEPEEEEEIDPELLEAQKNMAKYASSEPITTDGNVYNIMLVGLDTTKDDFVGNSDSMILISINYRLHKISMISFMRDLHVHIPGVGYRKLNAAFPNGGGPLLLETIEENFKIDINRYATVDFGNMIDIVDAIGPIEITFTEKEAENANKSIKQQCRILKLKSKKYLIPGEGSFLCNGMQTVAYARIRKVGNADYQRTERQREVLMKLLENIKAMDLDELDKLATKLLPMVTHNVPESEFWGLLAKLPTLLTYNIEQDRIPYDGKFHSYNGNLVPDSESTVRRLKETLYGEDGLDDEGNVIVEEEPEEVDYIVNDDDEYVVEHAIMKKADPWQVWGFEENHQILNELQPVRKAAVVADRISFDNLVLPKNKDGVKNPYITSNFIIHVPDAPQEKNYTLVQGSYQWKKRIAGTGIR